MTTIYINGSGCVSPQNTSLIQKTDEAGTASAKIFLAEPVCHESNQLKCIDPGYRDFIPAELIRRMGRIIKMGVAASKLCLTDAGRTPVGIGEPAFTPDAIITGTGLGCMEDTEKFLASMISNHEEFLTPTSFIQSTHNTVAGQIALLLKCHGYNFTYVHRGISFESALTDAMMQIRTGAAANVLAGGSDELTAGSFAITSRLGFWKKKPVRSLDLLADRQRGTIAGEGATFFLLENQKNEHSYAILTGVSTFLKPESSQEVRERLQVFLLSFGMNVNDLGLIILGLNGDERTDKIYHDLTESDFQHTPVSYFKHLCGEYHTAAAFAMWLASMAIKTQTVPEVLLIGHHAKPVHLDHILIYNHYRENNHAFILLSRP